MIVPVKPWVIYQDGEPASHQKYHQEKVDKVIDAQPNRKADRVVKRFGNNLWAFGPDGNGWGDISFAHHTFFGLGQHPHDFRNQRSFYFGQFNRRPDGMHRFHSFYSRGNFSLGSHRSLCWVSRQPIRYSKTSPKNSSAISWAGNGNCSLQTYVSVIAGYHS